MGQEFFVVDDHRKRAFYLGKVGEWLGHLRSRDPVPVGDLVEALGKIPSSEGLDVIVLSWIDAKVSPRGCRVVNDEQDAESCDLFDDDELEVWEVWEDEDGMAGVFSPFIQIWRGYPAESRPNKE